MQYPIMHCVSRGRQDENSTMRKLKHVMSNFLQQGAQSDHKSLTENELRLDTEKFKSHLPLSTQNSSPLIIKDR